MYLEYKICKIQMLPMKNILKKCKEFPTLLMDNAVMLVFSTFSLSFSFQLTFSLQVVLAHILFAKCEQLHTTISPTSSTHENHQSFLGSPEPCQCRKPTFNNTHSYSLTLQNTPSLSKLTCRQHSVKACTSYMTLGDLDERELTTWPTAWLSHQKGAVWSGISFPTPK